MNARTPRWGAAITLQLGAALAATGPATGAVLEVARADGEVLVSRQIDEGARWCIRWNHSVAGFPVTDCYLYRKERMVLERSHQPDFAAGLGHTPGRGVQTAAEEGGYWIEDIDEPVPGNCYRLRIGGAAVNHRLVLGRTEASLSEIAPDQSARITVREENLEPVRC